jgi:uncharacterized protein (DUF433 family)
VARTRSPIQRSPDVQGGQPVFAGTTVRVQALLDHLRRAESLEGFAERWPQLSRAQVAEVLGLALEQLIVRERIPVGPPQASLLPRQDDRGVITNAGELVAHQVTGRRVRCPACGSLVFKVWPEGWDSHAEHRCAGLSAAEGEARKAEFKRRYGHLFQ